MDSDPSHDRGTLWVRSGRPAMLCAFLVGAFGRVDADLFALGDEGGHQKHLGVGGRKQKPGAEFLDVAEGDLGLAGNDDFLPGSVVSGVPKGLDVVNGAEIVGAQVVIAAGAGGE